MTAADEAYRFCRLFEAELLLELMLRYWDHPNADDSEFRNELIECATEVLRASANGEQLMKDMPPANMNFVAAVWYSEWETIQSGKGEIPKDELELRNNWLTTVLRALPSCFCNQGDLP